MKLYTGFFICCLFFSCGKQVAKQESSILSVNVSDFQLIDPISLIDSVNCIPLETTSNSYFSDCWRIREYKDYYYIHSFSDFSVFIFRKSGQFIKRIDNRGKGKIQSPATLFVNTQKDELWILDERRFICRYSLQGDFIDKQPLSFPAVDMIDLDNNRFLFYTNAFDQKQPHSFILSSADSLNEQARFQLTSKVTADHTASYHATLFTKGETDNTLYTLLNANDTIYSYNRLTKRLQPYMHLDFNNELLTADKYPKEGFSFSKMEELIENKAYIFSIHSFYWAADKLFFRLTGKQTQYGVLDLKKKKQYTFPILFDDLEPTTLGSSIVGSRGNTFFFVFDSGYLKEHYKERKCSYKSIEQALKSVGDKNQQILFEVHIK